MQVSNQTVEVRANKAARTFTIRTYINGQLSSKYRTCPMGKREFQNALYHTEGDWKNFLKSNDYYPVK
jgi:hypothetical protein